MLDKSETYDETEEKKKRLNAPAPISEEAFNVFERIRKAEKRTQAAQQAIIIEQWASGQEGLSDADSSPS